MARRWRNETFWERDRRIGRGLALAWSLIAFSLLLLYAALVKAVLFG